MRTEQIEKEANLYNNEGECYIHVERTSGSPYAVIVTGDSNVVSQAVYNLIWYVADTYSMPFPAALKLFKKAYKRFGRTGQQEIPVNG